MNHCSQCDHTKTLIWKMITKSSPQRYVRCVLHNLLKNLLVIVPVDALLSYLVASKVCQIDKLRVQRIIFHCNKN